MAARSTSRGGGGGGGGGGKGKDPAVIGATIAGKWTLTSYLGAGAFGKVFKARTIGALPANPVSPPHTAPLRTSYS